MIVGVTERRYRLLLQRGSWCDMSCGVLLGASAGCTRVRHRESPSDGMSDAACSAVWRATWAWGAGAGVHAFARASTGSEWRADSLVSPQARASRKRTFLPCGTVLPFRVSIRTGGWSSCRLACA